MSQLGEVYFITDGFAVKVGFTKRKPENRLNEMQTGSSQKLKLIGSFPGTERDEKTIHKLWAPLSADGGTEWFDVTENAAHKMIHKMRSRYLSVKI
tara:strand:+ start:18672 stop:18959 length:288 start_codon:yes stop_codon:yes gene_type:complete